MKFSLSANCGGVVEGVGRVPAPHDDQLAVREGVVLVAVGDGAESHARAEGRTLIAGHRPRAGAATEHAEEAGEQALDLVGFVQYTVAGTGIGLVEDRRRPVFLLDLDHLARDVLEGLVPRHALELALAALADAHHGVEQALRRIEARTVGAATQAGRQLRHLLGIDADLAAFLVAPVVGGQADDDVALLVRHQHVARTAVVVAGGDDGGQLVVGRIWLVGERFGLLLADPEFDQAAGGGDRRAGTERLQEVAALRIEQGEPVAFLVHGRSRHFLSASGSRKRASLSVGRPLAHSGTSGAMPSQAWRGYG